MFPGITAYLAPGHTPGCLIFVLEGREHDLIFTGDSAKNRAELVSRDTDMSYDKAISRASIDMIWSHWQKKPGTMVIPVGGMDATTIPPWQAAGAAGFGIGSALFKPGDTPQQVAAKAKKLTALFPPPVEGGAGGG